MLLKLHCVIRKTVSMTQKSVKLVLSIPLLSNGIPYGIKIYTELNFSDLDQNGQTHGIKHQLYKLTQNGL